MLNRVAAASTVILLACGAATAAVLAQTQSATSQPLQARALGLKLFTEHCAACHGWTGHGNGPRAAELRVRPTDLTRLAQRNNWVFPAHEVQAVIDGADRIHQSGEMPLWGQVFRVTADASGADDAKARIEALVSYLEFAQARRPKW